jgi:hypothetical protein
MDFLRANTSLVIVGIWNPAILSPPWLVRYAFDVPVGQDLPVQIELGGPVIIGPRFLMNGVLIAPSRTNLVLQPVAPFTVDKLHLIERLAIRILTNLSHTPISAFGYNFEFLETAPAAAHLELFTHVQDLAGLDFAFDTQETRVVSTISFAERVLNLNRSHSNGQMSLAFNFHYTVTSAEHARQRMRDGDSVFLENFSYVRRTLATLYNVQELHFEEGPQHVAA